MARSKSLSVGTIRRKLATRRAQNKRTVQKILTPLERAIDGTDYRTQTTEQCCASILRVMVKFPNLQVIDFQGSEAAQVALRATEYLRTIAAQLGDLQALARENKKDILFLKTECSKTRQGINQMYDSELEFINELYAERFDPVDYKDDGRTERYRPPEDTHILSSLFHLRTRPRGSMATAIPKRGFKNSAGRPKRRKV